MSRQCQVTGKKVLFGNKVSHANNKTRRTFFPNIQDTSLFSEALNMMVSIRVTPAGLRTIDHKGGLDAYITGTPRTKLSEDLRPLKTRIEKALAKKQG
jgi:large subunit ribosomal protein L28